MIAYMCVRIGKEFARVALFHTLVILQQNANIYGPSILVNYGIEFNTHTGACIYNLHSPAK